MILTSLRRASRASGRLTGCRLTGQRMEMAGRVENVELPIDRMLHRIAPSARFGPETDSPRPSWTRNTQLAPRSAKHLVNSYPALQTLRRHRTLSYA